MMAEAEAGLEWIEVGTLDDLWEGEYTDVEVDEELILLVHFSGGQLRAYQGICPHQEIALADGDFDGKILTCTAHSWQFDASTGQGVNPTGCQLYRYEIKVEEETIYVGIPQDGQRHYNRCTAADQGEKR